MQCSGKGAQGCLAVLLALLLRVVSKQHTHTGQLANTAFIHSLQTTSVRIIFYCPAYRLTVQFVDQLKMTD